MITREQLEARIACKGVCRLCVVDMGVVCGLDDGTTRQMLTLMDDNQRLTERNETTDKALELFASRNTECYLYPWCLEHRDKDGRVSDPVTQTTGPCVSNLIKFTLAEAERILREGGCPR